MRKLSLKTYLKSQLDPEGPLYYLLALAKHRPIACPWVFLYSLWLSKKLTGSCLPIKVRFSGRLISVTISAAQANVNAKGSLVIESWQNGDTPISIVLGKNATFTLDGNFTIGQGVKLMVDRDAALFIGGRECSSGSGITADSTIMVSKSITIGKDVIIAWGVYITDSDWHCIDNRNAVSPVAIGDNVWISHDVSVLKGARIGQGSIIGAKSLVTGDIPGHCLAAGTPARVVRTNVSWSR